MVHVGRVLQTVRIMHEWQRCHAQVASGAREQLQYFADRSRAEEVGQLSGSRVTLFL